MIDNDERKHYLKPEQEVRNYFLALNLSGRKGQKETKSHKAAYFGCTEVCRKRSIKRKDWS